MKSSISPFRQKQILWPALTFVLVVIGLSTWIAIASATVNADPEVFEAASVKPNNSRDGDRDVAISPGGRFCARYATLRDLVQLAYPGQDVSTSSRR
jgi:hypothetical protein